MLSVKSGPVKWIGPYTDSVIKSLAPNNMIIYPLSFTIDNSETQYELAIQYAELAKSLGIKEYLVCECLNDSNLFVEFIEFYDFLSSTSKAGRIFPSNNSRLAPPPVDIKLILSLCPALSIASAVSPPPIKLNA